MLIDRNHFCGSIFYKFISGCVWGLQTYLINCREATGIIYILPEAGTSSQSICGPTTTFS